MKMFYQTKLAPICAAMLLVAVPSISSAQELPKDILVVAPGQSEIVLVAQNTRTEHLGYPNQVRGPGLYEREIEACNHNSQDRAACIREAGAAQQLRRQGELTNDNRDFTRNALERCANLPPQDQQDCEARIMGEGRVEGSVDGGGVIRERTTTTVVEPNGSVYQINR